MTVGVLGVTTLPVILRERSEPKDLLHDGGSARGDNFPCHPEFANALDSYEAQFKA